MVQGVDDTLAEAVDSGFLAADTLFKQAFFFITDLAGSCHLEMA